MSILNPDLSKEEKIIVEGVLAARVVQEFLWGHANGAWGLEEWRRMLRKRLAKLEEVNPSNPHAAVELKKRLLQNIACSVALLRLIQDSGVPWEPVGDPPASNLPMFDLPVKETVR